MRKQTALLFALLCALAALCATALADEPVLNGYVRDHATGVSLTCWYEDENDAERVESALCAVYGGDGALLTVADLDPRSGTQTVVIPCETGSVDHVKLIAMDAGHSPLYSARTLKPSSNNTDVPQFTTGYPAVSENGVSVSGSAMVRVSVTADRSCRCYWALYRHGVGYATAARFIAGDLPRSEKNGMVVLAANQQNLVTLSGLYDQTEYDLDLWLTNADFTASSYITHLSFTTVDGTPPAFVSGPEATTVNERSLTISYSLSENATLYWTAVEDGTRFPNPPTGGGVVTKEYAIKQVISGNGGVNHGKSAARTNASANFTVSGLAPQKIYHIWYVAQDSAGNYSAFRSGSVNSQEGDNPVGVCVLSVATLDKQPPSVTLETVSYPEGHPETPYADTSLKVTFSENVRRFSTGEVLYDLYEAVRKASNAERRADAQATLAECLRETVTLYVASGSVSGAARERTSSAQTEWAVDYRNVTITKEGGAVVLYFPSTDDANADSALHLMGGRTYYFQIQDISDTSENLNAITSLKTSSFTTMPAQILLKELTLNNANYPTGVSNVDLAFSATPMTVSRASADTAWDLLLWTDVTGVFEMYERSRPSTSSVYDNPWKKVQNPLGTGGRATVIITGNNADMYGQSMHLHLCQYTSGSVPALNSLEDGRVYEYAVRFLEIDGDPDRRLWDSEMQFGVTAVAATPSAIMNLAANLTETRLETLKTAGTVQDITSPSPFVMSRLFYATAAPTFANGAPQFTIGDTSVTMWFQMTHAGYVHYLLAPAGGTVATQDSSGRVVNWARASEVPESGEDTDLTPFSVTLPSQNNIIQQRFSGGGVKSGVATVDASGATVTVSGLKSDTNYFAYFVLQGSSPIYSTYAQLFRFTTLEAAPPNVRLTLQNPVVGISTNRDAFADYLVIDMDAALIEPLLNAPFWNSAPSGGRSAPSLAMQVASVLEAIAKDTGNGSVFDVYATTECKNQVAQYIRESLYDGESVVGATKDALLSATSASTVDCTMLPMQEHHQYALVVKAQGQDGGAYVFRAAYPITPPDSDPPLITEVAVDVVMDEANTIEANSCTGTAKITFDSNLYYLDEDADELLKVDLGPHYSVGRELDWVPIIDLASSTPRGALTVSTGKTMYVNKETNFINLTLTNAADGSTVTFPKELCDQYGNMHRVALTVTLRITPVLSTYDSAGNPVYEYRTELNVSPSWDGRTATSG